ncbi:FAD-binding and (Fe-S)-binding domain-containing protein [Glycomyces halotolerans]
MTAAAQTDTAVEALETALRDRVDGEIRFDAGSRGAYATDASNYRQVPIGVVVPRTVEAAAAAIEVCRAHDAPVLSRGGGTSLAGECTNTAVVVDWTKYCHRLVSVDPDARTCVVEPGIVLDDLNGRLAEHGLEFGPRPSTHSHCAIGGMVGNNSCGATAQRTGTTAQNVRRLEILTYDGLRCWVGPTEPGELDRIVAEGGERGRLYEGLRRLRDRYGDTVRERFPDIPRRISGYNLDELLPENGFDIARLLVGSEGTLATVLRAELELLPVVEHSAMVVLGYPDIIAAADAVPSVLERSEPVQLEAIDDRLIEFMRAKHLHPDSIELLPDGGGWLMAQLGGSTADEARENGRRLLDGLGRTADDRTVLLTEDRDEQRQLHAARESGLGATTRAPDMADTWPGWEDSAVPVDHLGDYLRDLRGLFREYDLDDPSLYGHFGHGCLHVRIPFRLDTARGVRDFRSFVERAADLVVSYGGSLSGEHGDGQARGELLDRMFGSELVQAFRELKSLFDPAGRMNPGKVVDAGGVDEDLRVGARWRPREDATHFGYPEDEHSFNRAVMRCVGVGKCRRQGAGEGVMCPSYQVTGEEEHSTRGRARLLFEMLQGHDDSPVRDGWRSTEVRDALDLCLACKGCKSDCPVNVDMATYKAEFLAHHYAGRVRPMAHYSLGWLPALARVAQRLPRTANALLRAPGIAAAGKRLAGVTSRRDAPPFAPESLQDWWRRERGVQPDPADPRTVALWPDTFANRFQPHVGQAAVRVLESAGFRVAVPTEPVCCALTWISTGQLPTAKRVLRRSMDRLRPWLEAGTPIVGLEPSCTAVFRADAPELMPEDRDVRRLREQFITLSEALLHHAPGDWDPPRLDRAAIVQKHCHHHAVMGFQTDAQVMRKAGLDAEVLESGCCGLAGNFGFERGHYEISMDCAEQALLPAVRRTDPDTLVLADGFSCRTQIEQAGTGRRAMHLSEALDLALSDPDADLDERAAAPRPAENKTAGRLLTGAAVGLGAAATGWTALRMITRARARGVSR